MASRLQCLLAKERDHEDNDEDEFEDSETLYDEELDEEELEEINIDIADLPGYRTMLDRLGRKN